MTRTTPIPNPPGRPGRKSPFSPEMIHQVEQLGRLGAEAEEIARFFQVCTATVWNWRQKHPEFDDALQRGKEEADRAVEESLFRRAMGYTVKETQVTKRILDDGELITEQKETTKHIQPSDTAIIFWLKNRRKDRWADVQKLDLTLKEHIDVSILSEEEQRLFKSVARKQLNQHLNANNN